jgi:WD40 repeat protein
MADIFISYSRRDIELVSGLVDELRSRGKTVFVDVGERLRQFTGTPAETAAAPPVAQPKATDPVSTNTVTAGLTASVRTAVDPETTSTAVFEPATPAAAQAATAAAVVAESSGTASGVAEMVSPDGDTEEDIAAERARAEISGIPPSAPWMDELRAAIRRADNIVVVISPDACASAVCREELDYAVELHKRLVPVIVRDTPADYVPPSLASLNWLPVHSGPSFDSDVDSLVDVLDTDVEGLHLHTRLTERSNDWTARGQDRSLLLRGNDLEAAEQWLAAQAARKPTPTSGQTSYIVASRTAATRRQRGSVAVGLALALVMTGLTVVAGVQWRSAVVQRRAAVAQGEIATSRALAAESGNELLPDPQLALLLALRAYDTSHTYQAESALRAAVGDSTVRGYLPPLHPHGADDLSCPVSTSAPAVFDPAGQYVAITCNGWAEVWRWASTNGPGSPASPYSVHIGGDLSGAIFNATGSAVIVAGSGGRIYQWNWRTSTRPLLIGRGFVSPVLYPSSTGPIVASEANQAIALTNLATGAASTISVPCCSFEDTSLNPAFAFSPDGAEVATLTSGSDQESDSSTLSVFTVSTGAELLSRVVPDATLPIAISSTGEVAVAVDESAEVFSVAAPSDAPVVDNLVSPTGLPAHCCDVDSPLALAWSPDGRDLAVGSEDLWTRVWTPGSAAPIYLDDSDDTGSTGVAFSPDGQYLLTSGYGSQVWQWQAATPMSIPAPATVEGTAVSRNGQIFAVAESNNTILLWDPGTGQSATLDITDSQVSPSNPEPVYLAFSPNGDTLLTVGPDDYLRAWSISTLQRLGEVQLPGAPASVIFSPKGSYFAAAWAGGVARWRGNGTGTPLVSQQPNDDGGQILSLSDTGALQMLMFPKNEETLTGELIDLAAGSSQPADVAPVPLPSMPGTAASLLPDGRLLLCSGMECWLDAMRAHSVKQLKTPALTDAGVASLTGDEHELYTSTVGGVITAWDLNQSASAVPVTTSSGTLQADATPNYLLIASDGALTLVPVSQDASFASVLKLARSHAVRSLTPGERLEFLTGTAAG